VTQFSAQVTVRFGNFRLYRSFSGLNEIIVFLAPFGDFFLTQNGRVVGVTNLRDVDFVQVCLRALSSSCGLSYRAAVSDGDIESIARDFWDESYFSWTVVDFLSAIQIIR
jgi:hypothetical protein